VLPAAVNTTPGISAVIAFGATPLVATGPVTVAFSASGASLSWAADTTLKVSSASDALAISAGTGSTLSLYGTAEQINAYLAAGQVKASGNGTVSVTLNGQSSGITGGSGTANSVAVSTATASAVAVSLPTLNLPSAMTVSTGNGNITLASDALGTGTDASLSARTVVVRSPAAP